MASVREIPRPQLDVTGVGPLTVLVINRYGTHGGLRTACLHLGLPAYIRTYIHTYRLGTIMDHEGLFDSPTGFRFGPFPNSSSSSDGSPGPRGPQPGSQITEF